MATMKESFFDNSCGSTIMYNTSLAAFSNNLSNGKLINELIIIHKRLKCFVKQTLKIVAAVVIFIFQILNTDFKATDLA